MVSVSKAGRPGAGNTESGPRHLPNNTWRHRGHNHSSFHAAGAALFGFGCAAARLRLARLDRATSEEMRAGLTLLCVVDPVGFEVALPARRPDPDAQAEADLGEPLAVCGQCGSMVALFPEDLTWRHYRGAIDAFGVQERFAAGHEPEVQWYLLEQLAEQLPV
jgi:hypothetical protein